MWIFNNKYTCNLHHIIYISYLLYNVDEYNNINNKILFESLYCFFELEE